MAIVPPAPSSSPAPRWSSMWSWFLSGRNPPLSPSQRRHPRLRTPPSPQTRRKKNLNHETLDVEPWRRHVSTACSSAVSKVRQPKPGSRVAFENPLPLLQVVQIMARHHADDMADAFVASFLVLPVVVPCLPPRQLQ